MEFFNWKGILVGALVPMLMGFIWYHPKLFGTIWMKSIGKTEEDLKKGNFAVIMILSLVLSVFLSFYLYGMLAIHDYITSLSEEGLTAYAHNFGHGAYHGAFAGVLMAVPVLVTNSLFEQRSKENIMVNGAYWIVTISLMSGVISLFM
jgi:hypothetical protein